MPKTTGWGGRTAWVTAMALAGGLPWAPGRATAGEWTITPSLEAVETYTDNVALDPPGQEEDEFITEINPGVTVIGEGNRANLRADYRMQNVFYASDIEHSTYHQLAANGTAQVVPRTFHVDADATIAQQVISPDDAVPTSNATVSSNRTDVYTTGISPYLMHSFDTFARGQARYRYQRVQYSGEDFNSQSYTTSAYLESGPHFEWWGWSLNGQDQRISYENRPDTRFRRGQGELNVQIGPYLQLFGSGGYEQNEYQRTAGREAPEGGFWEAGFRWHPTHRTSVLGAVGERFFGETRRAEIQHDTRNTTWNLSYRQELTTLTEFATERRVFLVTDEEGNPLLTGEQEPILVATAVPALTTEVYLSERYEASVTGRTAKSTITLNGFNEDRTFQATDETERVLGASINWMWEFRPRTRSDIGANFIRRTFRETTREDDLWYGHARLIHDIRPNLEASLAYERAQRESDGGGTDYRQNLYSLRVRLRF